MALFVQKFGGTSVASLERIRAVAERVAKRRRAGDDVIVVVSAMAGETDRLLGLGRGIAKRPRERELNVLVATGEQVTAALLAIQLGALGIPARSMLGHQARIETDGAHTRARIRGIDGEALLAPVRLGEVVVVAGFQGASRSGDITTLGRGGSDTSAVAIAAATGAHACEIYTDVDGVYTADPNVCPSARKVARISYEEMLELASLGAKVLQIRSVELAMKYRVRIHVRSSFDESEGTMVTGEDESLESVVVAGVTSDKNAAKVTIRSVPDRPGVVASIFEPLAEAGISVDMIIQNVSEAGRTDLTFTVAEDELERAREEVDAILASIGAEEVIVDSRVVKVSIVGLGMRSHAGIAARMFRILANEGVNIQAISTSEIKTSCLVADKYRELCVRALHDGFGLGD